MYKDSGRYGKCVFGLGPMVLQNSSHAEYSPLHLFSGPDELFKHKYHGKRLSKWCLVAYPGLVLYGTRCGQKYAPFASAMVLRSVLELHEFFSQTFRGTSPLEIGAAGLKETWHSLRRRTFQL